MWADRYTIHNYPVIIGINDNVSFLTKGRCAKQKIKCKTFKKAGTRQFLIKGGHLSD